LSSRAFPPETRRTGRRNTAATDFFSSSWDDRKIQNNNNTRIISTCFLFLNDFFFEIFFKKIIIRTTTKYSYKSAKNRVIIDCKSRNKIQPRKTKSRVRFALYVWRALVRTARHKRQIEIGEPVGNWIGETGSLLGEHVCK
jgi:hypothetical protein